MWNTNTGLCFVTFTEHTSSVTNVTFTSSGFVIVSASLDGTVRAFDLHRWALAARTGVYSLKRWLRMYSCNVVLGFCFFFFGRYRNFRTFTSPRPAQFSSLAVDASGELVSAGAQDSFEIFLWSMQTGRLLEVGIMLLFNYAFSSFLMRQTNLIEAARIPQINASFLRPDRSWRVTRVR